MTKQFKVGIFESSIHMCSSNHREKNKYNHYTLLELTYPMKNHFGVDDFPNFLWTVGYVSVSSLFQVYETLGRFMEIPLEIPYIHRLLGISSNTMTEETLMRKKSPIWSAPKVINNKIALANRQPGVPCQHANQIDLGDKQ